VFVCGDSKKEDILTGNEVGSNAYSSPHYYVQSCYSKGGFPSSPLSAYVSVWFAYFVCVCVCTFPKTFDSPETTSSICCSLSAVLKEVECLAALPIAVGEREHGRSWCGSSHRVILGLS
jgi:hypothetical protein